MTATPTPVASNNHNMSFLMIPRLSVQFPGAGAAATSSRELGWGIRVVSDPHPQALPCGLQYSVFSFVSL